MDDFEITPPFGSLSPRDAEAFVAEHPNLEAIDLLIADLSGVLRGKRAAAGSLPTVTREGVRMAGSLFALDIAGDLVHKTGLTFDEGERDRYCWPVTGTLALVPWGNKLSAQIFLSMHESDGRPFFADPQSVLFRIVERYRQLGLTPVTAIELEFYLFDGKRDSGGNLQFPRSLRTGERLGSEAHAYDMDDIAHFEPVLSKIVSGLAVQGVTADLVLSECAPAQFEINLKHNINALKAAEHALMLKRVAKGVAADHGLDATFMAQPLPTTAGSGMHVHMSLLDQAEKNVFADESGGISKIMRQAIAGIASTVGESFAMLAPNANSYRRYNSIYAPRSTDWGVNNRTTGLRIPPGPPEARRIEHRFAGADANPFLVLASVLAGALYGIEQQLEAQNPIVGNAFASREQSLPVTWDRALDVFGAAQILPEYFGSRFWNIFGQCRKFERDRFNARVTPLEYDWYLHTI